MPPATSDVSNPTPVGPSLWFSSFSDLLTELENAPPSSDLPPALAESVKEKHGWLLNTVTSFKRPSRSSNDALNAGIIAIGERKLSVKPELKDLALKLSSTASLDEVQSYIIAERSMEQNIVAADGIFQDTVCEVVLQYYIERQCLLKCTRQLFAYAVHIGLDAEHGKDIQNEAARLISDGIENKLISVLEDLLVLCPPDNMDVDLFVLWAEATLLEINLVLDILFLIYYESFCTCDAEKWKKLCLVYQGIISGSFNFGKLGVSPEAFNCCYLAKAQLLLILMETLNLEVLLQMIHDERTYRDNSVLFSLSDIREMDGLISNIDLTDTKEAGPLVLTWAVFLCLMTSVAAKEESCELMEIDHVGYVRQAFDAGSLSYFLETLQSNMLKDSDGPIAGCRSILRTFISAFVASYEINIQVEDNTLELIMTILHEIYRGEESLCAQFWDKDSVIDGPIRSLLSGLELEFPCQIVGLVRFLSALCEGTWPAECVYNFLDTSVGISSLFTVSNGLWVDKDSDIIETQIPLHVPGIKGLMIPRHALGHIVRVINEFTVLVRWQYKQSGLLLLLLRLAQRTDFDGNKEVLAILDLLSRLTSFSMGICFDLIKIGKMSHVQSGSHDSTLWIDVVEIICNVLKNLSPTGDNVTVMSMGVSILAKLLKCSPHHVSMVVTKMNIFDALQTSLFSEGSNDISSGTWILSGRLAKMMLIDCEQNSCCPLTISVLDFTMQLLEVKVENDLVLALVVFCIQYVFVNHEFWKYKAKQDRWIVTLKVLELMKRTITAIPHLVRFGATIRHIIFSDSSVHNMLLRIVCATSEDLKKLYVSRLFDLRDIEGWHAAISSVLEILLSIFSNFSEDHLSSPSLLIQTVLSPSTKPISAVAALTSLASYSHNQAIQVGALKVLSTLCAIADPSQSHLSINASFAIPSKQILQLRCSIENSIRDKSVKNEDFVVSSINLLSSAAIYQPAYFAAILVAEEITISTMNDTGIQKDLIADPSFRSLKSKSTRVLLELLLQYVQNSQDLIKSNAHIVLSILNFLKAIWQGAALYSDILEYIRKFEKFWIHLAETVSAVTHMKVASPANLSETEAQILVHKYQCQSTALDIVALEMFLQKKLLHAGMLAKVAASSPNMNSGVVGNVLTSADCSHLKNVLSSWSESSVLVDLLKSSAVCVYNNCIYLRAKIASSLFAAHVAGKLSIGDNGNLAVSFSENVNTLSKKLIQLPAFTELSDQYSRHSYSEGVNMKALIFSDLYYHLQGELEGRTIDSGPFKEIRQFLADSNFLHNYMKECDSDLISKGNKLSLFDMSQLRQDLGLDLWDYSDWKSSKGIAETMLLYLQETNSMLVLGASSFLRIKALIMVLTLSARQTEDESANAYTIPREVIASSINEICKEFITTAESVAEVSDAPQEVIDFIAAQSELLLCLLRHLSGSIPLSTCKVVLKTSVFGLKAFTGCRHLTGMVDSPIKFLLMILLLVMQSSSSANPAVDKADDVFAEDYGEVSNIYLGLLPILCSCSGISRLQILSLACANEILIGFSSPTTWLPIIQKNLRLHDIILKIQDKRSSGDIPVILKFFLIIAQVRGGAEMLLASGFLSSLRMLFTEMSDGIIYPDNDDEALTVTSRRDKKPIYIWGLGLSVLTSMICSLGGSSVGSDVVDTMIPYFFTERANEIAYHLSAPDYPSDGHDKKRARAQKPQTHLSALRETEHTVMLLCVLARHRNSWVKTMREAGPELREKSIHLLAFISKGNHYLGDFHSRTAPIFCLPIHREEVECCNKPPFVGSKRGWFALTPLGCLTGVKVSSEPAKTMAIVLRDQMNQTSQSPSQSYFSDTVAIQMYRIAFLLLKFLCVEASDATRRAEELGLVDHSCFPELPVPEILHGVQDQAIAIVTELCENAAKTKQMEAEIQRVCFLLLQITEMALYLELCVSQICEMRPVLGRVEDFTKEIKLFLRATEAHSFLKSPVQQLKQIVSFVYQGLLQNEGIS